MTLNDKYIYPTLRNKNKKVINDIYSDIDFSNYYQSVSADNKSLSDLTIYREELKKDDTILEIGSGNGRIFNPLFKEGFDIYGIEPSNRMKRYIISSGKNRVYPLKLQEIYNFPQNRINVVIIPATSVSLFSIKEFEDLIIYLRKDQLYIKKILFDFLPYNFFESQNEQFNIVKINNNKYLTINFLNDTKKRVIFNILFEKKIGISIKYIYTIEDINKIFRKYGIDMHILKNDKNYKFIEGNFK